MSRSLLLLFALPLGWLGAQTPTRYRVEFSSRDVAIGLGLQMAQMLAQFNAAAADHGDPGIDDRAPTPITTSAVISVTTRDSAAGKWIHLRIDSLRSNRFVGVDTVPGGVPPELRAMLADGTGGVIDCYLLHGSQLHLKISPQMNIAVAEFVAVLPLLYPELRANVKLGDHWSDTLAAEPRIWSNHPGGAFARDSVVEPVVTTWHMQTADSLEATVSGVSLWMLGDDGWSWRTTSKSLQHFTLDARRTVRDVQIEITTEKHMNIDKEKDALSSKVITTIGVTRLEGRP